MRLISIFIFLTISTLFAQQLIDGVAAVVDDEIILFSDIDQALMSYAYQNKIDLSNDPVLAEKMRKDFLDRMIVSKVLLVKARQDTIEIDDERVQDAADRQYNNMLRQVGSEQKISQIYNMPISRIKRFMEKNIREQMLIEQVRNAMVGTINISRREVSDFYNANIDSIPEISETVELGHILNNVKPSDSALEMAKSKTDSIYSMIESGEDFSLLAQKYSDDPGSGANGGDLGFTERGQFVAPFEEAAYKLNIGEISKPVLSEFGYHIIQLLEKNGDKIHTRHILIMVKSTDADAERTIENMAGVREQIVTESISFSEAALKYSDDPNVESDKGVLGLFEKDKISVPEFKDVASILNQGEISEPFSTRFGVHIIKLFNREPARKLNLEDDYEKIKNIALNHKRENEFKRMVSELREDIPITLKIQN